jgi:LacI family transcriptional regulator
MTTIKDVARVAGVSIATVSALLNGTARVSDKLSQRIWAAIESTGYSPHGIARSLRLGRTRSIGLVVGDISNPFFTSLAKTVEARAVEAGYMVIVANSDEEPEKELKLLKLLREQRVAGILLTPSGHDPSYLLALSRTTDIPIVLLDRLLPQSSFDSVVVDNLAAARMGTDYLVRLNHRRIALVIGKQHIWTMEQRLQGYRESLRLGGIEPNPDLELVADTHIETAYEVVQRLLTQPDPPTAIFAANIIMMLGAIEALMDMGFRCPEQVSLAGIDDFPGSSAIRPLLTTVTQPIEELAERAVSRLLEKIGATAAESKRQTAQTITLMPRLVIRDSCARLTPPERSNMPAPR